MPSPQAIEARPAPSFHLIERQPLRPSAILLAILAAGVLSSVVLGLSRSRATHRNATGSSTTPAGTPASGDEEKDDPSQVDTIVLGDPADAPVPGRPGDHVSAVHPTILVHLPRYGDQVGLIPNTPTGHLLYGWLAAFNQANYPALEKVLPNTALASTVAGQRELRRHTGGFNLLSAREVQPGILVFRLRDQTPSATEVLGTLQAYPNASPAAIASFSLRAVISQQQNTTPTSANCVPRDATCEEFFKTK